MENKNKLYELLEKEELTNDEKEQVDKLISEYPEVSDFVEFYNSIGKIVGKSSHLDVDILGEYILYQSSDEFSNVVISRIRPKIESHLRTCTSCMENYKILSGEYEEVNNFIENVITEKQGVSGKETSIVSFSIFQNSIFKFVPAIAAVLIIYAGVLFFSNVSIPNYQSKVLELKTEINYNSRGRTTEQFLVAVSEMEKGDQEKAIEALQKDLDENNYSPTIFYSHFILGQIYLQNSSDSFLGIKLGFNDHFLNKSIIEFNKVIELNKDPRFSSITLDAKYFLGQANLLLGNVDQAKINLNEVIENKGKYLSEAKELLSEIESK